MLSALQEDVKPIEPSLIYISDAFYWAMNSLVGTVHIQIFPSIRRSEVCVYG